MNNYKRIFLIVLDSLGVGASADAELYGDAGADTFGNIAKNAKLNIPNLQSLGMANLHVLQGVAPTQTPLGRYCKLSEASNGKDTMTGHWEMVGIHTKKPFKTFTETGFPLELIAQLEEKTGKKIIGNKSSSGTEILDELAHREIEHGELIVYTSADSVLQICGNEETMGLDKLYEYCETARELTLKDEWRVGRVIARPYVGKKTGEYKRTPNRKDYALKPPSETALDILKQNGKDVLGVGKIEDIFDGEGLTYAVHSQSSVHGMEQTIDLAKTDFEGLCFTNLVDFDALWGHRRNVKGYAEEIDRFDVKLGELLPLLTNDDLLIITADHGNDPTFKGTDHTRENVPFLAYSPRYQNGGAIKNGDSFADIGTSIAENFGCDMPKGTIGTSKLSEIL